MKKGIIIGSSNQTKLFLTDLLFSLQDCPYEVVVHDEGNFELGAIKEGKQIYDEFVYLMDTTVIKDITLFDKLFQTPGHVFLSPSGFHYMGKFVSKDLPEIPEVKDKEEAIKLETSWLNKPHTVFSPELPVISEVFETRHGRLNMVLETPFIIKFKARWK